MYHSIIDSHIHFDLYEALERESVLLDMDIYGVEALIAVSNNLSSARKTFKLSQENPKVKCAFGYHPEQPLPEDREIVALQAFIKQHHKQMIAIGEVGLPYYLRKKDIRIPLKPYIDLLALFIQEAVTFNKPIVLHAVYEDAPIVCTLLEQHSVKKAHFHWFKGDKQTSERMIQNKYYISITPDIVYEEEIRELVKNYPLSLMMVETDGPWPFAGPFRNKLTHPKMIHCIITEIAAIKRMNSQEVYRILYENTKRFYCL